MNDLEISEINSSFSSDSDSDNNYSKMNEILKYWMNKAISYKNLHLLRYQRLNKINKFFIIPVIFISTLTGTANFAQDKIPYEYLEWYVIGLGCLSLISAFISTIYQFLKISESADMHKKAYIEWEKFFINLNTEFSKLHDVNISYNDIIKSFKLEYIKLIENSPLIPGYLVNEYNSKYNITLHDEDYLINIKK